MKKSAALFLVIGLLISGCSFDVQVVTPSTATETLPIETPVTPSPIVTVPTLTETPTPGFTPTTSDPIFFGAYMAQQRNGLPGQTRFAAGTDQLFAVWTYQNMRAGLTVKREWYLDGLIWLEREEPWDFAKYGERGTMPDVSIFDFQVGLPPGVYQLMMYIDGVRQPIGRTTEGGADAFIEFEILPPIEAESPNGGWVVRADLGRLILFDTSGGQADIFTGREVVAVAWFPDSQRLLLVDRDRSGQIPGVPVGIRDDLWLIDINSLEIRLLREGDTGLGVTVGLAVSPDGRYIASSEGSGFGDACFVDVRMIFFEVAGNFASVKAIKQEQFSGLPVIPDGVVYPTEAGSWETNTGFSVPMGITCASIQNVPVPYVFDVTNLKVAKP